MSVLQKDWGDGSKLNVTYTGSGNGTAVHTSPINESIDREVTLTLSGTGNFTNVKKTYKTIQAGKREVFNASDGAFKLSDGSTFNVLKTGMTP